ncbi:ABC transporter permease subunit [Paenibacillus qinlingensis]|uniref:Aldouronate transport system permease protein n=1 Tax=Paenibacillus qinlingensis TaxID=1837343 RepID=A0ABU1NTZ0_9BACL|nr:ABC transporter permease subunit [Paenibacillus qinlingensis]MDR6550804.1 putative aldouronate transport system permease protein [Paenibacillus qinlingensis]
MAVRLENQSLIKVIDKRSERRRHFAKHKWLYLFLIPGCLYLLIFKYIPIFGVVIAFKDFSLVRGIWASEWVGLDNFQYLFQSKDFYVVLRNTLILSFYQLLWGFPAPIILAIMLNEVRHMAFKRVSQTILYLPHFISWVVLAGMIINFLSPSTGAVNTIITSFGYKPIPFLLEPSYFRTILVSAEVWKGMGWGTIIYLAAMTGIDSSLYEAAKMDGASRVKQILHITIPGILPTIVILIVLQLGHILDNGFEQVFLLYNPSTYEVADVLETYTYRIGLIDGRLSFSAAVGLFKAFVGFVLVLGANRIAKLFGHNIW